MMLNVLGLNSDRCLEGIITRSVFALFEDIFGAGGGLSF